MQSIKIAPDGKTATATVKSIYNGKKRTSTVTLTKEGGGWKVSSFSARALAQRAPVLAL